MQVSTRYFSTRMIKPHLGKPRKGANSESPRDWTSPARGLTALSIWVLLYTTVMRYVCHGWTLVRFLFWDSKERLREIKAVLWDHNWPASTSLRHISIPLKILSLKKINEYGLSIPRILGSLGNGFWTSENECTGKLLEWAHEVKTHESKNTGCIRGNWLTDE